MRWIIGALVLFASTSAHAMGFSTTFDLKAWSPDGTSALLSRSLSNSGGFGQTVTYIVVTASDKKPLEFPATDTLSLDNDKAKDKVDAAACARNADALDKALAARHFKGVKVDNGQCKTADRQLVAVAPETEQPAVQSFVVGLDGPTYHSPPNKRESVALAAAKTLGHDGALIGASPGDGTLVIVFYDVANGGTNFAFFNKGKLVAKDL